MYETVKHYKSLVKSEKDYLKMTKHFLQAFFFGGIICLFGEGILYILTQFFTKSTSATLLSIIMISFSAILTAIGIYDDIGQVARCGIAVPITGFANSCVSAAMEYKNEGIVVGIASNMFKLAGSVIVIGVLSAYLVNFIRLIVGLLV